MATVLNKTVRRVTRGHYPAITGEPLGTSDASTAAGQAADAAEAQINEQKLADGTYTPAQAAIVAADYSTNADGNVGTAAVTGFTSGFTAQAGALGTTVTSLLLYAAIGVGLWLAYKFYAKEGK